MRVNAVAVVLMAVLSISACAHAPAGTAAAERDRLEQRQSSFLAALAARDAERTSAHFAADAALHVAGMPPVHGRDAIRAFYGNVFRFMAASQATPEQLRVSVSADLAYTSGRVVNTFQAEQGAVEFAGKYLLVWEQRARDWVIVVYSLSSNQPDAGR
jgi:ketosteroid isomerase-like protein